MGEKPNSKDVFSGTGEIWQARQRIAGLVNRTPLVYSAGWSERYNASIYLKLEYLHPTNSFKLRGAANKILSLDPEERERGVATFSTGNHGLAVAYVARSLEIPAAVFLSQRVPQNKVQNLRAMGAEPVIYGDSQDEAEEYCFRKSEQEGWTVIKPFDDPQVIAGQGTIGLELLEQLPEIDTAIVPVSGGGLISGIALALKNNRPGMKIIGVSMEGSPVMYHSLRAGKPVELKETDTLADSLLGGIGLNNRYTFAIIRDYVDRLLLVSEAAIARAMADIFKEKRIAVEGAAATGLAALEEHRPVETGSNVALIISGNSVDASSFMRLVSEYL